VRLAALNRHLQFLCSPECDFLAGFDLDCFSGGWIAAHASGAFSHLQNAETRDTDPLALLEMLRDQADEIAEEGFTSPLRQLMLANVAARCLRVTGRLVLATAGDFDALSERAMINCPS
jgi:hypothetical protein